MLWVLGFHCILFLLAIINHYFEAQTWKRKRTLCMLRPFSICSLSFLNFVFLCYINYITVTYIYIYINIYTIIIIQLYNVPYQKYTIVNKIISHTHIFLTITCSVCILVCTFLGLTIWCWTTNWGVLS